MIEPRPAASIAGSPAAVASSAERTLTFHSRSISSAVSSSLSLRRAVPALFTSTSSRPPNASRDVAIAAPGPSGVPRSAGITTGSLVRAAAVRSSSATLRATSATRAPAASRATLMAAPMPRPAPVMTAVRPSSAPTTSVGFGDRDRVDDDVLDRAIAATGLHALHRVEHVEALHDLSEQAVLRRQANTGLTRHQEELAAVRVRPGVRHRHRADLVLTRLGQLVVEAVAGTAPPGARRIAALAHEAVDDAVEDDPVVVVVQGEE